MLQTIRLAMLLPWLAQAPSQVDSLLTVAERSGYHATARHGEVMALCEELARHYPATIRLSELGRSVEGRPLPLLMIADPPVITAEEARQSGKLVVMAVGNIHAGEVCGKEALLMLAREIASASHHHLLKDLVIIFAPIYNADGNERVAKGNRPGQDGPADGMGQRANARGLDLNRDFIKLEAPETRALVRFLATWNPHLFIDTHTTNGSLHRYIITYEGPKNPATEPKITEFMRTSFFPQISRQFEAHGQNTYYYGNFDRNHTHWTTYPAEGRYGTTYVGLRNRLSVLSEAYAYAPYKDRVLATRDFVRECLALAAARKDEIKNLLEAADKASIAAGTVPQSSPPVPLRSVPRPLKNARPILGFDESKGVAKSKSSTPKDYPAEVMVDFTATETVVRPYAYLIQPGHTEVVATLKRHGISVHELREDIELDLEVYRIDEIGPMPYRGWDVHKLLDLRVTPRKESRRISAGTFVVKTAQRLGSLIVYLLEPRSEDGLGPWRLFGDAVKVGKDFPVIRLPQATPVLTVDSEPLAEDLKHGQPITFNLSQGLRGMGGAFSGSATSVTWLDDDHWLQTKEGTPYRVEARSGRATPFGDGKQIIERLRKLPGIGSEEAESVARQAQSGGTGMFHAGGTSGAVTVDQQHRGFIFTHDRDLYYGTMDGSIALRLTNHPGDEEHPRFSPDGKLVAFIRNFDLHVVSVENPTERALTAGGRDNLRHGIADWVYFEEIFNRNWPTFWWSPDSKKLAFLEIEDSQVGVLTMLDDRSSPRKIEQNKYPRSGEPNPKVRLGFVPVNGGPVQWADLSGYPAESALISDVGWFPTGDLAYCYVQDRVQTWLDLMTFKVEGGSAAGGPRRLFRETTKAWVADQPAPRILKDGSFLWLSERDGWKHIYHYAQDGSLKTRLTSGDYEVRSIDHVDPGTGWVTFTATKDAPMAPGLYRVKLAGGPVERLTRGAGSHQTSLSPGGHLFLDTVSDLHTPAKVRLRQSDGSLVRIVDTNPVYTLKQYRFGPRERVQIRTKDGFTLEAELILPPDLDEAKKYPVWFKTYGGPHTSTVTDGWLGGRIWDQALATEGFIVFLLDPRSASGKGAVSAWTAYKRLGIQELEDIKEAIAWLKERPYVDGSRIGMAGHSFGGFMTSFAMTHCDLFAAGIAGAPVTDWRDYDSIYTERFMGLPSQNKEGYEKTSVVRAAKNLHGKLLLAHGLIDDNVSVRNTMRLVEALQQAGKDFELMIYPSSRHGILSRHYSQLQLDFIRRALGKPQLAKVPPTSSDTRPVAAKQNETPASSH